MGDAVPEGNLVKPRQSKAETKADVTNNAAKAIIGAEVERREAKTLRLRKARLENETRRSDAPVIP